MTNDDDDMEDICSKHPSSSNANETDLEDVLHDDIDTRGTDQSENHDAHLSNNDDGDETETDGSEENIFAADASFKTLPAPKPQRNFTLVLSKTRTSTLQQAPSPSSVSKTNSTTPIKITTGVTKNTSPLRIKLSLKKLPTTGSNSKASDKGIAQRSTQSDPNSSPRNTSLDGNISNGNSGKISNKKNQGIQATDGQSTTTATVMYTLAHGNVSSNSDYPTSDMILSTKKVKLLEPKSIPIISKAATGTASKRRSFLPTKQVRMPPLTSPGLCMLRPPIHLPPPQPPPKIFSNHSTSSLTFYTPQQIFDVVIKGAGYTYEERTNHPHRGSSVQRTIDDMFDTNVHLSLRPIELIPKELWNHVPGNNISSSGTNDTAKNEADQLPHLLIAALEKTNDRNRRRKADIENPENYMVTRKRPRPSFQPMQLCEMVPVSLTIPYPEWYLQKRVEYVKLVKERELAIVEWQEAQEEIDMMGEDNVASGADVGLTSSTRSPNANPVTIPPIPQPPDPPTIHDLSIPTGISKGDFGDSVVQRFHFISPHADSGALISANETCKTHPYYLPKSHENLVEHLDPNCFHITDGRYFGLETNLIADPNFVGPNAPGLSSSTNTGGLATATTATTTSTSGLTGGGMTMILSASYHSAAAVAHASVKDEISTTTSIKVQPSETEEAPVQSNSPTVKLIEPSVSASSIPTVEMAEDEACAMSGKIATTRTLSDLRTIMEGDDLGLIEAFRECIVRSIVHTHRSHKSVNIPFHGPNNETYPDIGKAFAWYGGIKPCDRCKSNKQGVRTSAFSVSLILQLAIKLTIIVSFCDRYCIAVYGGAMMTQIMMEAIR